MRKERIEKVLKTILPELLKEFRGPARIEAGAYNKKYNGDDFATRFEKEIKIELKKVEENYPLIERIVTAYNNALLKK